MRVRHARPLLAFLFVFTAAALSRPLTVAAMPASVPAKAASDRDVRLGATFTPRPEHALDPAPILGELDLHVFADGRIAGFFRRENDRVPEPLSGGTTAGGRTFFDIGSVVDDLHVDGTLALGTGVFDGTASLRGRAYDVTASPCDAGRHLVLCE